VSLAEPIIVAEFWANRRGESIRVQLREFEGIAILDVRKHYTAADGVLRPTKKGLSLVIRRLPDLAAAIAKAERQARELGLLGQEAHRSTSTSNADLKSFKNSETEDGDAEVADPAEPKA
jgi:Transcriptional Coactivator p15 (PC4)